VMHRDGVTLEQAYGIVTPDKPLKRAASPEEGAAVVCFLAGSEAGMMTGAVCTSGRWQYERLRALPAADMLA